MKKYGHDHIDKIVGTHHDPNIMHALENVFDLALRNYRNSIRCKDIIAQDCSIKRLFVLSYILISFTFPEPLELKACLLRKISSQITGFRVVKPREKGGPIPSKLFLRSPISDVDVASTTGFH